MTTEELKKLVRNACCPEAGKDLSLEDIAEYIRKNETDSSTRKRKLHCIETAGRLTQYLGACPGSFAPLSSASGRADFDLKETMKKCHDAQEYNESVGKEAIERVRFNFGLKKRLTEEESIELVEACEEEIWNRQSEGRKYRSRAEDILFVDDRYFIFLQEARENFPPVRLLGMIATYGLISDADFSVTNGEVFPNDWKTKVLDSNFRHVDLSKKLKKVLKKSFKSTRTKLPSKHYLSDKMREAIGGHEIQMNSTKMAICGWTVEVVTFILAVVIFYFIVRAYASR